MLSPDTVLQNRYQIVRLVAEGGMGAVYEARDRRLGNIVALKETLFAGQELRQAFHREAEILAGLKHQALPRVIDHFSENDGQFLVMEWIPGDDLGKLMQRYPGQIPQGDALKWADRLLETLEYLHTRRPPIIHRDIKPNNIKLDERGEIILLDFGLAKEVSLQASQVYRSVRGYSLVYAPLEQIQGTGTDPRSDLYGAAATIYHLITGVSPIDAVSRATAIIEGRPDPLPPARVANSAVSVAVSAVLEQAMAQDRSKRQPNAQVMRTQLRLAAENRPETVASPSISETVVAPTKIWTVPGAAAAKRQNPVWIWIASSVLILTLLASGIYLIVARDSSSEDAAEASSIHPEAPLIAGTIPLTSRELIGRGTETERLYSFMAGPGEIKLTLDGIGSASVKVEALDKNQYALYFNGGRDNIRISPIKDMERKVDRLIIGNEQPVMLRISMTDPQTLEAFRLRIDGPAKLEDRKPSDPAVSALIERFKDFDNPSPLTSNTIYGGPDRKLITYYRLTAGPGEIRFVLDVINNYHGEVHVEAFNEEGVPFSFRDGKNKVSAPFDKARRQNTGLLLLGNRQQILMRISNRNPENVQGYRLRIDGPVEIVQSAGEDTAAIEAVKKLFDTQN
jgi:serine/threonine protein kinase